MLNIPLENLQRSLDRALRIKKMPLYATSKGKTTKLKPTTWSRYIKSSRKCQNEKDRTNKKIY